MRHVKAMLALAALALTAGGCGRETVRTAASPSPGATWHLLTTGSPTPSPTPSRLTARPSAPGLGASVSPFPSCTKTFTATEAVLIPVDVTPIAGGFKVEWPRQYGSNYRVTAVPQKLVLGAQPEPSWKNVPPGTGCTVSTTITGLVPGAAYIVWLDAPNTGYERDGTRHLYSGRSGVVYPR
ncbi:hypothetical protein ACWT_0455 [Actinoplanes sp. SE50]|uniref:hypothetical protein n=1 Tax=unclassified Actinoplanes TaxID=2626549 RepID=UPI00023EC8AA|nr:MULTISPECIES: hypothetical protein [unclassified Actinoplanes]AEV81467.1 hypothetical protein ACPL_570 [Actinoplanes sp. SE50/110]ATO79870.1 hypothetical protein ACWT_0455 [Actinoplanes sp. SE50]SLL97272.1 hypothetical protein ACSP50_0470 [Actinoplanes sp. SE50/110]